MDGNDHQSTSPTGEVAAQGHVGVETGERSDNACNVLVSTDWDALWESLQKNGFMRIEDFRVLRGTLTHVEKHAESMLFPPKTDFRSVLCPWMCRKGCFAGSHWKKHLAHPDESTMAVTNLFIPDNGMQELVHGPGWFCTMCCRVECKSDADGGHYHCPLCTTPDRVCAIKKLSKFREHLGGLHGISFPGDESKLQSPAEEGIGDSVHTMAPSNVEESAGQDMGPCFPDCDEEWTEGPLLRRPKFVSDPVKKLRVQAVDAKHGVYIIKGTACGRAYTPHVIVRQSLGPGDGGDLACLAPAVFCVPEHEAIGGKTFHCVNVRSVLHAIGSGQVEPSDPGSVLPSPPLDMVGKGRQHIPEQYKAIEDHARVSDSPLVVDITPASDKRRFVSLSILEYHKGFARVVVHVPNARAADSDNNRTTCTCRHRTMNAPRCVNKKTVCVHVAIAQAAVRGRVGFEVDPYDMETDNEDDECAESLLDSALDKVAEDLDPDVDLDTTADVLRIQRRAFPDPDKSKFWDVLSSASKDMKNPFGLPGVLEAPGEICYRLECRNRLQQLRTGEVTVMLHNYATCKRNYVRKTCTVCRAAHDWFGWGIGFHNMFNMIVVSFAFILECEAAFVVDLRPIGSVFPTVQYRLKRYGQPMLPEKLHDASTQAVLQFATLAWLCEPAAEETETTLEAPSTAAPLVAETASQPARDSEEVVPPVWDGFGGPVCGICGDSPKIMVYDATMKFRINVSRKAEELKHDQDGRTSYSREEFVRKWRQKQNVALTAAIGGMKAYPNFRCTGRMASLPFISRSGANIYDSECEKDSSRVVPKVPPLSKGKGSGKSTGVLSGEDGLEEAEETVDPIELDREVSRFLQHYGEWRKAELQVWYAYFRIKGECPKTIDPLKVAILKYLQIRGYDVDPEMKNVRRLTGGLMIGSCLHGVVYYAKTLLNGESARDHLDAARSTKAQPIVYVGDQAMNVGIMAEKYAPEVPAAKTRGATCSRDSGNVNNQSSSATLTPTVKSALPIARTTYDGFHLSNQTDDFAAIGHNSDGILELIGQNTQVCEQLNVSYHKLSKALSGWNIVNKQCLLSIYLRLRNGMSVDEDKRKYELHYGCRVGTGVDGKFMELEDQRSDSFAGPIIPDAHAAEVPVVQEQNSAAGTTASTQDQPSAGFQEVMEVEEIFSQPSMDQGDNHLNATARDGSGCLVTDKRRHAADIAFLAACDSSLMKSIRAMSNGESGQRVGTEVLFPQLVYSFIHERSHQQSSSRTSCAVPMPKALSFETMSELVHDVPMELLVVDYHILLLITKYRMAFKDVVLFPSFLAERLVRHGAAHPNEEACNTFDAFVEAYNSCNLRDLQAEASIMFVLQWNSGKDIVLMILENSKGHLHVFDSNWAASSIWVGFTKYEGAVCRCQRKKALREAEKNLSSEAQFVLLTMRAATGNDWLVMARPQCTQRSDVNTSGPLAAWNAEVWLRRHCGLQVNDITSKQDYPSLLRYHIFQSMYVNGGPVMLSCAACNCRIHDTKADFRLECNRCLRPFHGSKQECSQLVDRANANSHSYTCYVCRFVIEKMQSGRCIPAPSEDHDHWDGKSRDLWQAVEDRVRNKNDNLARNPSGFELLVKACARPALAALWNSSIHEDGFLAPLDELFVITPDTEQRRVEAVPEEPGNQEIPEKFWQEPGTEVLTVSALGSDVELLPKTATFSWARYEKSEVERIAKKKLHEYRLYDAEAKRLFHPFFQGLHPVGGRLVDTSKREVTLFLMKKPHRVWQCRGCDGHLGKLQFMANPKNAPFNLVVGTAEGVEGTPQEEAFRKKFKKDVGYFMHFRPFCVRRMFPNAQIVFLHEVGVMDAPHKKMVELFSELQEKYHVNTWVL